MHVCDRHPHGSWRGPKPTWRTRWPKDEWGQPLKPPYCPPKMRANFTRFSTTPDWASIAACHAGAYNLFRSRRSV